MSSTPQCQNSKSDESSLQDERGQDSQNNDQIDEISRQLSHTDLKMMAYSSQRDTIEPTQSRVAARPGIITITGRIDGLIENFTNAATNDERLAALRGLSYAGLAGTAVRAHFAAGARSFVHQLSRSRQAFISFMAGRSRQSGSNSSIPTPSDLRSGNPADDALLASWWIRKQAIDGVTSDNERAEMWSALEHEVDGHFWNDENDQRVGEAWTEILNQKWVKDFEEKPS
ncbi:hypothetical protein IAR50_002411 [Cryptococcus sp. DSM 104548]